jgi:acyl-CoA hydrolase
MQSTQQETHQRTRRESVAGNVQNPVQDSKPSWPPKAPSHETIHRFCVKPADVGIVGVVDGGTLLEWIDKVAYAAAAQWSGRYCVTAYVGNFHLDRPISVGALVELHATLVYTGRCSMHILVTVYSSDSTRGNAVQTSQCPIIFVALDDTGNPVEVPPWTPITMLELQRQRQARVRIPMRTRIEGAMAAECYTDEGTAPSATLCLLAAPTDVNWSGKVGGGRVMRWMTKRPPCAEPTGPARKSSRPISLAFASTGPSTSATSSISPHESFTPDLAASTPASTSPPGTPTAC